MTAGTFEVAHGIPSEVGWRVGIAVCADGHDVTVYACDGDVVPHKVRQHILFCPKGHGLRHWILAIKGVAPVPDPSLLAYSAFFCESGEDRLVPHVVLILVHRLFLHLEAAVMGDHDGDIDER